MASYGYWQICDTISWDKSGWNSERLPLLFSLSYFILRYVFKYRPLKGMKGKHQSYWLKWSSANSDLDVRCSCYGWGKLGLLNVPLAVWMFRITRCRHWRAIIVKIQRNSLRQSDDEEKADINKRRLGDTILLALEPWVMNKKTVLFKKMRNVITLKGWCAQPPRNSTVIAYGSRKAILEPWCPSCNPNRTRLYM